MTRSEKLKVHHATERDELIAEIESQLQAGASPILLPARLGYDNAQSLVRRLHRAGRHDLAAALNRSTPETRSYRAELDQRRKRPCRGCPGTCSRYSKHQLCYGCSRRGAPLLKAAA